MSYNAAQYFMSYVPKEGVIYCRLYNRAFPSSIIMQSLGLTEITVISILDNMVESFRIVGFCYKTIS